jgi:hypothetical protein
MLSKSNKMTLMKMLNGAISQKFRQKKTLFGIIIAL